MARSLTSVQVLTTQTGQFLPWAQTRFGILISFINTEAKMRIHTFQGNPTVLEVNTADKLPAIQTFCLQRPPN